MSEICLVTIVIESGLRNRLVDDLKKVGVHGYTEVDARGEGSRGMRTADWEGKNVRIETLVSLEVADLIFAKLSSDYFAHYAVAAWSHPVKVLRHDKYG